MDERGLFAFGVSLFQNYIDVNQANHVKTVDLRYAKAVLGGYVVNLGVSDPVSPFDIAAIFLGL